MECFAKMIYEQRKKENGEELNDKIIEMLSEISNEKILKLIYGFVLSGYREEKAAKHR